MLEKVCHLLDTTDSFAAMDLIESEGDPAEVAGAYSNLVRDLFGKKRDIPGMIMIGNAGIRYCLNQAQQADEPELQSKLKGLAKTMAYNLSANAWPGWDDGVSITRSDSLAALDAARLNLRLAKELDRDASVLGNAHWLVGAQHLALKQPQKAIQAFEKATQSFHQAEQPAYEAMAQGYIAIAQLTTSDDKEPSQASLAAAIKKLESMNTDDSNFFASQLATVAKLFVQ